MLDAHGRAIDYLRLSVTDLCDLRCIYCMPESGVPHLPHSNILRVEECIDIAKTAVELGIRKIRITGGEPLVRRGILEICQGIGALPGLQELCITTNGRGLADYAVPLRAAGVSRLNISLDTLDPDKYRMLTRWGQLQEALDGIQAAEAAGFTKLKINAVLMGGVNEDEIPALVELTRYKPYAVRFIELMPLGECAPLAQGPVYPRGTGAGGLPGPCAPSQPRGSGTVPNAGLRGNGGFDPPLEPPVLRQLQPDPGHGGRDA